MCLTNRLTVAYVLTGAIAFITCTCFRTYVEYVPIICVVRMYCKWTILCTSKYVLLMHTHPGRFISSVGFPPAPCIAFLTCFGMTDYRTIRPPPSPEDALAAQLALLGEDSKASGKGKRKGNVIQPAAGEGASTRIGAVENVRPQRNVRRGDEIGVGGGGSGSDRNEMSDVLYCSCCGREYTAKELEDAVARANASR